MPEPAERERAGGKDAGGERPSIRDLPDPAARAKTTGCNVPGGDGPATTTVCDPSGGG